MDWRSRLVGACKPMLATVCFNPPPRPARAGDVVTTQAFKLGSLRLAKARLRRAAERLSRPERILLKRDSVEAAAHRHGIPLGRVLNVGSKNVRVGQTCVNLDIVSGPGVDVVADAHDLELRFCPASFETVVLNGVLQYCEEPRRVLAQVHRVLVPGGWLFLDAPFIQPYCPDGPDLWRFTEDGLRRICAPHFTILEITPSIGTGPALAFAFSTAARAGIRHQATAFVTSIVVRSCLWPLRYLGHADTRTAGALLLVARKP